MTVREVDLNDHMHLCEQLYGQGGTIRTMAMIGGRLVVGCTDGRVQVWKPYEELVHKIRDRKSMKKTMTLLKKNFSIKDSNMIKEDDLDVSDDGKDDEKDAKLKQQSDWVLHQTMDHGSAVTAIAEVFMKVRCSAGA